MNESHRKKIKKLLLEAGLDNNHMVCSPTSGDGSDRIFVKVTLAGQAFLAVLPSPSMPKAMAEATSACLIGRHLYGCGVPVPQIFAYCRESGGILFEFLGDQLLQQSVKRGTVDLEEAYGQALEVLVHLQVKGRVGFKEDFCWDTARYDRDLMLNRESGYFTTEFCQKYLAINRLPDNLADDFKKLALRVALESTDFLMHRDFQSRNLMVRDNRLVVIDFQGARFGPLAYDLASLLNDPYTQLADEIKNSLLDNYLVLLTKHISLDHDAFVEGYYHISLQRNLQILGAFAFLTLERGKLFFKEFINPAFSSLYKLLNGPLAGRYPSLQALVGNIEL